jgi:hypothetical protein
MTILSLMKARWITPVMLASSAGVLQYDGPAPVSLPLLLLESMVVLDQHGVQHKGDSGSSIRGSSGCRMKGDPRLS